MPSSASSSPMDAIAGKNEDEGGRKVSRGGGGKQKQLHSSWGAMALKNRSQPGGGGGESRNSSSSRKKKKKTTSISISKSMTCAGSICSTKESSVLSRGSRRRSSSCGGRSSSSRSLKAPDNDAVSVSASASAAAVSASSSFNSETTVATTTTTTTLSSSSSALSSPLSSIGAGSGSFRALQISKKLSGCYYECNSAALDPRTSLGGGSAAMLSCADCDEVFVKADSLELHRASRHAVSELGAEDTSRNVVEIIFQSSWLLKKQALPVCKIERILKVRSSGKTVERFEQYRERVKAKAASSGDDEARRSYPRCAADGNELLRFHCTTFNCSLGLAGATALCRTSPQQCKLCGIIRDGFSVDGDGKIATMATSWRAHNTARVSLPDGGEEKRAMLVCRVVAGRVKKVINGSSISSEEFGCDSVSVSVSSCSEGIYSDLDELHVFNPGAILPCFAVIYSG